MTAITTTAPPPQEKTQAVFRAALPGVTYDDIPALRQKITDFLALHGHSGAYADMFCLTLSEVLSNLVQHPTRKADAVDIRLRLNHAHIFLDVADNSTPFADFDAKCKIALSKLNAAGSLQENGYGLGCILRQHAHVFYTPAGASPDKLNHFRVREALQAAPVRAAPPDLVEAPAPASGHKARIFLVDDDPVALQRHQAMLQELYDVTVFHRAQDAVAAFAQQRPDLIVSDLNMPEMDGIGLRQALAVLAHGNATPFVFLSAQTASQDSPYISELGVDDFLCKPVEKARLLTVASRLITRAQQVRQALEGRFQQHLTQMLKPALPPRYAGWRLSVMTAAAAAGGGDFTLCHEAPGHFLAVLADVMGHGEEAKFFSYAYAGYLRSLFRQEAAAADPAAFLKALSASIEGDAFLESIILTCQSFQLFADGRAHVSTAGHPAPLIASPREGARAVDIAGPLPGLVSQPLYHMAALRLEAGDKLVFATDGFLHAFGAEGSQRQKLMQQLGRLSAAPGDELAAALWQDGFAAGSTHKDDATLIVAEYGGNA